MEIGNQFIDEQKLDSRSKKKSCLDKDFSRIKKINLLIWNKFLDF